MKTNEFGARLRALRVEAGLSQSDLAEKISMSRSGVSNWEHGTCEPGIEQLKKLGEILSVSVDTLVDAKPFLTENELLLIQIYRSMNDEGKEFLLQNAKTASASGLYKKYSFASVL